MYEFNDLLSDLDAAVALLSKTGEQLRKGEIKSPRYRYYYDNNLISIALAAEKLIVSIRKSCISEVGTIPLSYFCARPLHELCIDTAAVYFQQDKFSAHERRCIREAQLMQALAFAKNIDEMKMLLEEERSFISEGCYTKLVRKIEVYQSDLHYTKKGFFHYLNDCASKKITKTFQSIDTEVQAHPAFTNFLKSDADVMFSGILHGNPIGVMAASEPLDTTAMMPLLLIRLALYDAELQAIYTKSPEILDSVVALRDSVLKKIYIT